MSSTFTACSSPSTIAASSKKIKLNKYLLYIIVFRFDKFMPNNNNYQVPFLSDDNVDFGEEVSLSLVGSSMCDEIN